jgi:hypothetical protein
MHDDDTEEWPEATAATPKRVVRVRGRIRHVAQPDRVLTPDEARQPDRVLTRVLTPDEHRTERAK